MTILGALMGFLLLSGNAHVSSAPKNETPPSYVVTLTAYNAVPGQTDDTPFETASGAYSNPEVIAARSRDLADELPFGTIIEFSAPTTTQGTCGYSVVAPVIGYRVIEDTMNARYTSRIDVLLHTNADYKTMDKGMKNAAQVLGICTDVAIRVVGYVDINNIPKTQVALAALVTGGPELALK